MCQFVYSKLLLCNPYTQIFSVLFKKHYQSVANTLRCLQHLKRFRHRMCFWNSKCESEPLTASKWIVEYPSRLILCILKEIMMYICRHAITKQLNCYLKEYCDVLQVPVLIRNLPLKVWTVKDQSQLSCPIRPILIYLFGKMIRERAQ